MTWKQTIGMPDSFLPRQATHITGRGQNDRTLEGKKTASEEATTDHFWARHSKMKNKRQHKLNLRLKTQQHCAEGEGKKKNPMK